MDHFQRKGAVFMEIKDADYVLAIARNRNISKAAKELYISQPSLSRYLSNLEARLGTVLFERQNNDIVPTSAGEIYIRYSLDIAAKKQDLYRELQALKSQETNVIRIGFTLTSITLYLWEDFAEFYKKYPNYQIETSEILNRDIEQALVDNRLTFAVSCTPEDTTVLNFQKVCDTYFLVLIPASNPVCQKAEQIPGLPFPWIDLNEISNEKFILQNLDCRIRRDINQVLKNNGITLPHVITTVQSSTAAIQYAEKGIGLCFCSDSFYSYISRPDNVKVFCIGSPVAIDASGILSLKNRKFTPQEKLCIKIISQNLISRTNNLGQ